MIELYHGSNVEIKTIDLSRSRKGKDFGCGFYLNPNREQAEEMAVRTTQRMMEGSPIVNRFLFDEAVLTHSDCLSVKIFSDYTLDWAEFILQNMRNLSNNPIHPYDIVVGPIANDTVGVQMRRYLQGYISIERMIDELKFKQPSIQYFFGTEQAIQHLKRI